MAQVTNFAEVQDVLRPLYDNARTLYTLDNMRNLMEFLGNPQNQVQIIHVAGTSGKTSTSYYITSLLAATGKQVGLTVSPHVDQVNERVQINCVPIPETEFCELFSEFHKLVESSNIKPSYFEFMVAFAYWVFAKKQVDYAVVEVGLGGLLDGTNVVNGKDKICVITDIGLDHTEILGDTIDKIATQKAGIIQAGNEVYMHKQASEVMNVVKKVCAEKTAFLHIIEPVNLAAANQLPVFQQHNFALAEAVVSGAVGHTSEEERAKAAEVYIPARMEQFDVGDKTVIVDGSHNGQKLQTLFSSIKAKFPEKKIAALVGFVEGDAQRLQGALGVITKNANNLIVTSFYTEKDFPKHSVDPSVVAQTAEDLGYKNIEIVPDPKEATRVLLGQEEEILVITGSFYLLNHVRPEVQGRNQ